MRIRLGLSPSLARVADAAPARLRAAGRRSARLIEPARWRVPPVLCLPPEAHALLAVTSAAILRRSRRVHPPAFHVPRRLPDPTPHCSSELRGMSKSGGYATGRDGRLGSTPKQTRAPTVGDTRPPPRRGCTIGQSPRGEPCWRSDVQRPRCTTITCVRAEDAPRQRRTLSATGARGSAPHWVLAPGSMCGSWTLGAAQVQRRPAAEATDGSLTLPPAWGRVSRPSSPGRRESRPSSFASPCPCAPSPCPSLMPARPRPVAQQAGDHQGQDLAFPRAE